MPSAQSKLEILIEAQNKASGPIKQVESNLKGLDSAASAASGGLSGLAGAAGVAGIVALGTAIAGTVTELARGAAETERLATAFDNLASSAGSSGESMLSAMNKAAQGTVSNADLMASANRAMLLGVADSAQEMAQLMDVAAARGKAMGESTGQAFSDLVTGIGRMSPMILDNLGITIDAQKAFEDYAQTLGTTANQLDEAQKKQAILNAVISSSTDLVRQNKAAGDDAASNFERMDAAISNAKDALGDLFGPAVAAVAQKIADAASSATQAMEDMAQQTQGNAQAAYAAQAALGELEQRLASQTALLADMKANGEESTLAYQNLEQAIADTNSQISAAKGTMNEYAGATGNAAKSSYDLWIAEQNANVATQQAAIASREAASARGDEAVKTGMLTDKIHELTAASQAAQAALAGITSAAIGALESSAKQAIGIMPTAEITRIYAENKRRIEEQAKVMDQVGMTTDEIAFKSLELAKNAAAPFDIAVEAAKEAEKQNRRTAKSVDELSQEYQGLLSATQSVLQSALDPGVGVDPDKVLEKMGIPRADAINENARRLADIAQNGLKNQDWLGAFQQEVPDIWKMIRLAQNPQEEAAHLLQDFQDGLLTSPIDKNKAKEIIKRQILGDENMAAMATEIATELSQEMGIPMYKALAAAQGTLGGPDGAGGSAATSFTDGMIAGTTDADTGGSLITTVDTQMRAKFGLLAQAGRDAAKTWSDAFLLYVGDNVPPALISLLTDLITPQVMARFTQTATQQGMTP